MNELNLEDLRKIKSYIEKLNNKVGLKSETILDVFQCVDEYKTETINIKSKDKVQQEIKYNLNIDQCRNFLNLPNTKDVDIINIMNFIELSDFELMLINYLKFDINYIMFTRTLNKELAIEYIKE